RRPRSLTARNAAIQRSWPRILDQGMTSPRRSSRRLYLYLQGISKLILSEGRFATRLPASVELSSVSKAQSLCSFFICKTEGTQRFVIFVIERSSSVRELSLVKCSTPLSVTSHLVRQSTRSF